MDQPVFIMMIVIGALLVALIVLVALMCARLAAGERQGAQQLERSEELERALAGAQEELAQMRGNLALINRVRA